MREIVVVLVAAASIAASAPALEAQAGQGMPARADSAARLPSVALPPELDRVLRDYERAWRAGDASRVAALFAGDGMALPNGRPAARGRAAIAETYRGSGGELRLRALGFATADTVGWIIGAYAYGADSSDVGKFVLALRRAPGGPWRIAADIDNANRSPRRPAQPAGAE